MSGHGQAGVPGEIALHRVGVELTPDDRLLLAVAMEDRAAGSWCRDAIRRAVDLGPLTTVPVASDGQDGLPPRVVQVNLSDREHDALRARAESARQSLGALASRVVLRRAEEVVASRGGRARLGLESRAA